MTYINMQHDTMTKAPKIMISRLFPNQSNLGFGGGASCLVVYDLLDDMGFSLDNIVDHFNVARGTGAEEEEGDDCCFHCVPSVNNILRF
jgi:hypothetical protein